MFAGKATIINLLVASLMTPLYVKLLFQLLFPNPRTWTLRIAIHHRDRSVLGKKIEVFSLISVRVVLFSCALRGLLEVYPSLEVRFLRIERSIVARR